MDDAFPRIPGSFLWYNVDMKWKKIFAMMGIWGPLVFFMLITALGPFWRGYSPLSEYISVLGSTGSPYRSVVNIFGFVLFGLIVGFVAASLAGQLAKSALTKASTRLLRAGSVFVMLMGVFPVDRYHSTVTLAGNLHRFITYAAFILLPASMVCLGLVFKKDAKWGGVWTAISLLLAAGAVLAQVLILLDRHSPYVGLIQRLGVGAALFWVVLVSINLFLKYQMDEIFPLPEK